MKAQAEANETGKKSIFLWRGYRGVLAPNLPPMTPPGVEVRLMNALQGISFKSTAETMVNRKKKLFLNYLK